MGSISSKSFIEMIEEPVTPRQTKRVLTEEFDPRSPSTEITRTPIQIERTPHEVLDPRSPTVGISRTPIYTKQVSVSKTPALCIADTLKPIEPCEGPESATTPDVPEKSDLLDELSKVSISTATEATVADTSSSVKVTPPTIATPGTAKELPKDISKRCKPTVLFVEDATSITSSGPKNKMRMNPKSACSPLRAVGEGQRSPLAQRNVDMNSPRVIVQRKQTSKLGIRRPSVQGLKMNARSPRQSYQALTDDDKENK